VIIYDMDGEIGELIKRSTLKRKRKEITLQKAIEMGEYEIAYLSTFPEWQKVTTIMQWQMIIQAIKNRRRFLELNWAETFNLLDFSKKPELADALKNIERQLEKCRKDEERLRVEWAAKM